MNASTPTVSVLMLVHNAGDFLVPAVRSVKAQSWSDLELILVDNASNDGAVDALLASHGDRRLRVFREENNLGIAGGTNRAMAAARGRLISVMDHDDEMVPEKIARQVAWLEEHPEAGGVASRTVLINEAGSKIGGDLTLHDHDEYRTFTAYSQSANFGSHLFRRELLEAFPRRPEFQYSSDFDFVARAVERWPIGALPEVLFRYRVHPEQTTRLRRAEQVADECVIRVLTALRRSGRAESFHDVLALRMQMDLPGTIGAIHLVGARSCLRLGLAALAAYHARRAVGALPACETAFAGARICWRAMLMDRRNATLCARLFLSGPLRTHRLHVWPPC